MAYTRGIQAAKSGRDFWSNYQEILHKIDAESILEHYGAQNVTEQPGKYGKEFIHSCLIDTVHPHHNNGDESPSAGLNADKLLYNCWSFGGGDILWFIQTMEDCDREQALEILAGFIVDTDEPRYSAIEAIRKIYNNGEAADAPIPKYSTIILEPWLCIHPYLTETRGLNEETLQRYCVGYDEESIRIVLPHFWMGKLVGYQKRRLDEPQWPKTSAVDQNGHLIPKYQNSKDFPRDQSFFNYDTIKSRGLKKIILVESVMSVLKAESWFDEGHSQWGNTMATFGGKLTVKQIEVLREFDEVVLWLDNDHSGWSGTVKAYDGVKDYAIVPIIDSPSELDLADLDLEDANEVYATRRPGSLAIAKFRQRIKGVKQ